MEKDRIKISELTDCISGWEEVLGYEMLVDLKFNFTLVVHICSEYLQPSPSTSIRAVSFCFSRTAGGFIA